MDAESIKQRLQEYLENKNRDREEKLHRRIYTRAEVDELLRSYPNTLTVHEFWDGESHEHKARIFSNDHLLFFKILSDNWVPCTFSGFTCVARPGVDDGHIQNLEQFEIVYGRIKTLESIADIAEFVVANKNIAYLMEPNK